MRVSQLADILENEEGKVNYELSRSVRKLIYKLIGKRDEQVRYDELQERQGGTGLLGLITLLVNQNKEVGMQIYKEVLEEIDPLLAEEIAKDKPDKDTLEYCNFLLFRRMITEENLAKIFPEGSRE